MHRRRFLAHVCCGLAAEGRRVAVMGWSQFHVYSLIAGYRSLSGSRSVRHDFLLGPRRLINYLIFKNAPTQFHGVELLIAKVISF